MYNCTEVLSRTNQTLGLKDDNKITVCGKNKVPYYSEFNLAFFAIKL